MQTQRTWFWAVAVVGVLGCVPTVEETDTLVSTPRVLAIAAEPAEAAPRQSVKLRVLYADGSGSADGTALDWALCVDRKSLAELGPINRACLQAQGDAIVPLAPAQPVTATIPNDTCRLFGPEPGSAKEGEPAGRPADPDPTGGFYQPVRVLDHDTQRASIFETRISCTLAGVTQSQSAEFTRRYRPNQNPALAALAVVRGTSEELITPADTTGMQAQPLQVKPGEKLTLRASWSQCTAGNECGDGVCGDQETRMSCRPDCAAANGCSGAEPYLYFDRGSRRLLMRRESMHVAWFSTAGSFGAARTGRSDAEASATSSDNTWTAPTQRAGVDLWVVLRDDRGGVGWQHYRLHVAD